MTKVAAPSGVLLGDEPVHSDAWHALRAGGIGASEVAAILGLSPWQSPYSLWHAKAHGWITDPSPEMQWGTAMEPVIRQQWAADHGAAVYTSGTWAHRTRRWQRCNPDGLIVDITTACEPDRAVAGLEIKTCSGPDAEWGSPGTDEIPTYYRTQVMWCMDVIGVDVWHVAVSRFGRYPNYYVVKYDPAEARLLRGHCAAFWRSLRHGIPPELDGSDATLQTVRRLHPDIDGEDVVVDERTADAFWDCREDLAMHQDFDRLATAELLTAMGTARRAIRADRTPVARRQPGRGGSVSIYNLAPKGTPR
jgi:putative phage-type endonuclease